MRYWTAGPFSLETDDEGLLNFDEYSRKQFWLDADAVADNVSMACGCYVFTIRNREKTPKPWYVGKAERQDFKHECLTSDKISKYNNALQLKKGVPELWFYARITAKKFVWSSPTTSGYSDIRFLEKMLIGQALEINGQLININETAMLRSMIVPGLINTPQGGPRRSDTELARVFGY